MAAYPAYQYQASITPTPHRAVISAEDGTPRIRDYQASVYYDIELVHPLLTTTEAQAIDTFYSTNKGIWNTWLEVVENITYDVLLSSAPAKTPVNGSLWEVRVLLTGKPQ